MFGHVLRPVLRTTRSGVRSYQIPKEVRSPHMDELPVPSGSWKEAYDKKQTNYNIQLVVGVLSFIGTVILGRMNGTLWLNFSPPTPKK